ncbi:hypothetical protein AX16_001154 [Volvariella volvacea WC 439]|nr:hypothetical protein AX16_001154 [Volvariella volvacea WC 439]
MLLVSVLLPLLLQGYALPPPAPDSTQAVSTAPIPNQPTNTRTTSDIVYRSIGIILVWTYLSLHHNIPDPSHSWLQKTLMKLRTMFIALLAPEFICLWAILQRLIARTISENNKQRRWTMAHGFFVQMGGLVERKYDPWQRSMEYEVVKCNGSEGLGPINVPDIPEKEIAKTYRKRDIFLRVLILLQTTWFITQCLARHAYGLAVTPIELTTLAYIVINAITHIVWWDKPEAGSPIYFDLEGIRIDAPEEVQGKGVQYQAFWEKLRRWTLGDAMFYLGGSILFIILLVPLAIIYLIYPLRDPRKLSVPSFYAGELKGEYHARFTLCVSAVGVAFGGVHLLGWNFPFQTAGDLEIWQTYVFLLVFSPLPALLFAFSLSMTSSDRVPEDSVFAMVFGLAFFLSLCLMFAGFALYILSRVLVLPYIVSFYLPDSAYETVGWTRLIPHI